MTIETEHVPAFGKHITVKRAKQTPQGLLMNTAQGVHDGQRHFQNQDINRAMCTFMRPGFALPRSAPSPGRVRS